MLHTSLHIPTLSAGAIAPDANRGPVVFGWMLRSGNVHALALRCAR